MVDQKRVVYDIKFAWCKRNSKVLNRQRRYREAKQILNLIKFNATNTTSKQLDLPGLISYFETAENLLRVSVKIFIEITYPRSNNIRSSAKARWVIFKFEAWKLNSLFFVLAWRRRERYSMHKIKSTRDMASTCLRPRWPVIYPQRLSLSSIWNFGMKRHCIIKLMKIEWKFNTRRHCRESMESGLS